MVLNINSQKPLTISGFGTDLVGPHAWSHAIVISVASSLGCLDILSPPTTLFDAIPTIPLEWYAWKYEK